MLWIPCSSICDEQCGRVISKRPSTRSHFDRMQCAVCSPSELAQGISIWLYLPPEFDAVETLALEVLRKSKLFVQTDCSPWFKHSKDSTASQTSKTTVLCLRHGLPLYANGFSQGTLSSMKVDPATFTSNVVVTRNSLTHAGGSEKPTKNRSKGKTYSYSTKKCAVFCVAVCCCTLALRRARSPMYWRERRTSGNNASCFLPDELQHMIRNLELLSSQSLTATAKGDK